MLLFFFVLIATKSIYSYLNKKPSKEGELLPANYCETHNIKNPADCILARQMGTTSGDAARALIEAKQITNFHFEDIATTKEGMFAAPDDYGTSYYYRGVVDNNYVKFGEYYYRIVRITGDGNIKLIYQGPTANASGSAIELGNYEFNLSYNAEKYVGYVYDTSTSSNIKKYIDTWYVNNIRDKGLADYLSDTGFCGDRTSSMMPDSSTKILGSANRLMGEPSEWKPNLKCLQKEDNYTVSDTNYGNAKLFYPIALLSADEVGVAGGNANDMNTQYYLYNHTQSWLISPAFYWNNTQALVYHLSDTGNLYPFSPSSSTNVLYRPVFHLQAYKALIESGDGTVNNPYVVKTS